MKVVAPLFERSRSFEQLVTLQPGLVNQLGDIVSAGATALASASSLADLQFQFDGSNIFTVTTAERRDDSDKPKAIG